jgi:hypothetical protein
MKEESMAYKLEVKHPQFEDGLELDFGGIMVPNNGSVTLTEEQEQAVVARHGKPLKDALENDIFLKISGTSELSKREIGEILGEGSEG